MQIDKVPSEKCHKLDRILCSVRVNRCHLLSKLLQLTFKIKKDYNASTLFFIYSSVLLSIDDNNHLIFPFPLWSWM